MAEEKFTVSVELVRDTEYDQDGLLKLLVNAQPQQPWLQYRYNEMPDCRNRRYITPISNFHSIKRQIWSHFENSNRYHIEYTQEEEKNVLTVSSGLYEDEEFAETYRFFNLTLEQMQDIVEYVRKLEPYIGDIDPSPEP